MCSRERNDEWKNCWWSVIELINKMQKIHNYPPKGRWIVVDLYREAKRQGIYPLLFTDPEWDSCFSIYHIGWIKNASSISSSETFAKQCAIFLSIRKTVNIKGYSKLQGSIKTRENCYPLIWQTLNRSKCTFIESSHLHHIRSIDFGATYLLHSYSSAG